LGDAEYTLLDRDLEALQEAREHLTHAGPSEPLGSGSGFGGFGLSLPAGRFDVHLVHADAFEHLAQHAGSYDLILANAVLDLMDLKTALPKILSGLVRGGLYHFSINFDGDTVFLPELPLDDHVMRLYHRTMDERVRDGSRCGDSKCGRHLLELLPEAGASVLAAGSSDWVVFPQNGAYLADEAYFLHHIVNTIDVALRESAVLERAEFLRWIEQRHVHVEQGRLIYIAHQLDMVGRVLR
jgi:hypothetical protein